MHTQDRDYREVRQHQLSKVGEQRNAFQIDRDRIIYSHSFRRLAQVTQVVSASEGNVFHNRLTHSLKVAQVGRRLAEYLIETTDSELLRKCGDLDPDVVESAALAHDLGHPPFGHIAEKELDKMAIECGLSDGFEGNAQTFRILTLLEPHRNDYPGINLTRATLNATLKYPWFRERDNGSSRATKRARKYSIYDLDREAFEFVRTTSDSQTDGKQTLEASIMEFADDLTYSIHDLEDFFLAGLIPLNTLLYGSYELDKFVNEWKETLSDNEIKQNIDLKALRSFIHSNYGHQYTPGSMEQSAYIKQVSSSLIQGYIHSVTVNENYGKHGYLCRPLNKQIELEFLQRIVWKYVILNPRLATQQLGQGKIIKTLFKIYSEAIEHKQTKILPSRFLKDGSLERFISDSKDCASQKTRLAIDIVASLSEIEAVTMYRRLTGANQGSVMDYIV